MTTSTSTFPSLTVWLFESLGPLVSFGWLAGPIGLSLSELVVWTFWSSGLSWLAGSPSLLVLLTGFQVGVPDLLVFAGWWGLLASWFLLLFWPSPLPARPACWLGLLASWLVYVFLVQNKKVDMVVKNSTCYFPLLDCVVVWVIGPLGLFWLVGWSSGLPGLPWLAASLIVGIVG